MDAIPLGVVNKRDRLLANLKIRYFFLIIVIEEQNAMHF